MALTSAFFDAELVGGEYDRVYSAERFAEYFASFIANGVFSDPATNLQVVANIPSDMTVLVKSGLGWINGYYCNNDGNYPLTISPANGTLPRVDAVVLRWSRSNRSISLEVKTGVATSSPSAPSLERSADNYELMLASIQVVAGATSIAQANITDKRPDSAVCGWVKGVVDQIDTTDLFAQYDDAFQTWFAGIQAQLSGDVATNLQNQINNLKDGKADTSVTDSLQNQVASLEDNKVNVSDKANTSQAQAGTDDTKWMTPKTTNVLVSSLINKVGDTLSTLRTDLGDKWLLCNGAEVDKTTYPSLYDLSSVNKSDATVRSFGDPYDIASDETTYVMCGYDRSALKALIGYTVNPTENSSAWTYVNLGGIANWEATRIMVRNGVWVAVGYSMDNESYLPVIATTTNPAGDWTVQTISSQKCQLTGLVYAFGKWITAGSTGNGSNTRIFTTANPMNSWAETVINTENDNFKLEDLAFNGATLCAIGYGYYNNNPYALVKDSSSGPWVLKKLSDTLYFHLNSITYADGKWVAAGQYMSYKYIGIYVSLDLNTWQFKEYRSVAYYGAFIEYWNGSWYVGYSSSQTGYPYMITTTDPLEDWEEITLTNYDDNVLGVSAAGNYLFALGRDHSDSSARLITLLKKLPQISVNGVYTYIKAKE